MIRPDDPFKRSMPPASYQPNPPASPAVGKTPGTEPAGSVEPPSAPAVNPPVAAGPTDVKDVRERLGIQDLHPFDPEQGLTFPGGRTAGPSETPRISLVSSLMDVDLDAPDFQGIGDEFSDNLDFARFYHEAARDAFDSGDTKMGKDLLKWAREFDQGAPDIPHKEPSTLP